MNSEYPHRRSIRLKDFDYSRQAAYFITICSRDRHCCFGIAEAGSMQLSEMGRIANDCWQETALISKIVVLDDYVIMPNHFHAVLILAADGGLINQTRHSKGLINQTPTVNGAGRDWILMKNQKLSLGKIVRHYKAKVTKLIHDSGEVQFAWQRNYYEHIVRDDQELNRIREYIRTNPSKWQLDRENPLSERFDMEMETYYDGILEFAKSDKQGLMNQTPTK